MTIPEYSISKHYGDWVEIRNRDKCYFDFDEFRIHGSYYFRRPDVFMKGAEARYFAQYLMGLEGKNMWRGYSEVTGEPPGNEAGEANADGMRVWFRVFFKHKGAGISYIEFTLTGEGEDAPAFCWWVGNAKLGDDSNPHPCVIMQVSRFEITNWLDRVGWLGN